MTQSPVNKLSATLSNKDLESLKKNNEKKDWIK